MDYYLQSAERKWVLTYISTQPTNQIGDNKTFPNMEGFKFTFPLPTECALPKQKGDQRKRKTMGTIR